MEMRGWGLILTHGRRILLASSGEFHQFPQNAPTPYNSLFLKLSILFSGGLKDGLRHWRNSWKLSFQSAFSSDSSMRASTQSPLKQNIGEMLSARPQLHSQRKEISTRNIYTWGSQRRPRRQLSMEKVSFYTDFPQSLTILTPISIQPLFVIPDVRSIKLFKCSLPNDKNFLINLIHFDWRMFHYLHIFHP